MSVIPDEDVARRDWFDRASDWCNPILVKEVRQALKSRAFVVTFLLLLLGSWMISAFGLLAAGPSVEYGSVGQAFFTFYFGVLCMALGVVVPFGAFRSLLNERDDNTYELLSITSLTPGQIVRGKWACAIVQTLLFYSAIAPFIAFTSLLQGFDFAQAGVLLIAALYGSLALSITTLMLSTTAKQRVWQGFLSMSVVSGLCGLIALVLSGLSTLMMFPLPLDQPEFWWASYQWLFYQIAAARLTFESENRSTGIRLTASAQFWLFWGCAALYAIYTRVRFGEELVIFLIGASGVHLAIVGLAFSAEPDFLSRRVRRTLPRLAAVRPIWMPLLPGGSRGFLFLLLHVVALWVLAVAAWAMVQDGTGTFAVEKLRTLFVAPRYGWRSQPILFATAVCCYIVIYAGLAASFLRWGQLLSPAFQGAHARTIIVILIAAGGIVPVSIRLGRFVSYGDVSIGDVMFPLWMFLNIFRNVATAAQMWTIAAGALVVIALNIPAMIRASRTVLAGPVASASRPHIVAGETILEPAGV
ncbi:MAG: hypothetical protein M3552_01325 [Planctomycetota bacterium]|nr:hypothetical protein [Planctomycetota bacterium]